MTIPLPCAGWTTNRANTLYKYKDPSGASCKSVVVKAGELTATCKGVQVAVERAAVDRGAVNLDADLAIVVTLNAEAYYTEFGAGCPTRVPESNCLDGLDNDGDGLADCQDPTCLGSQTQCVPAVGAGAVIGVLQANGPCPPGYSQLLNRLQGLQGQPCVGCTCATACSVTVFAFTNPGCSGANASATFTTTSTSFQCASVASSTRSSSTRSAFGKVCQPGGTATQAAPTWSSRQVFCVAESSQTCAAGQVCVPAPTAPAKTCADVDGSFSCPAGYSGTSNDFFAGFTPGSCGSCSSCTSGPSLTCSSISTAGTASCAVADVVDASCGTIGASRNPVAGLGNQFIRNGTDDCTITPTNVPPQPTEGRRVCCLP